MTTDAVNFTGITIAELRALVAITPDKQDDGKDNFTGTLYSRLQMQIVV